MDEEEIDLIIEGLRGKNKSRGGLNINELRKAIINELEITDKLEINQINKQSREILRELYLHRFDKTYKYQEDRQFRFKVLILCANDETIENGKSIENIKIFFKSLIDEDGDHIFDEDKIDSAYFDLYYVNGIESEIEDNLIKKDRHTYLADIGQLNKDIFGDQFFNLIYDEYCPINAPKNLTQNSFKWFHRILDRKLGFVVIGDFTDVLEDNRVGFYEEMDFLFNRIDNVDDLLEHIAESYDETYEEEYSKELEQYKDDEDAFRIILHKYCDRIIDHYYHDVLERESRIFVVGNKSIKNLDDLSRIIKDKFTLEKGYIDRPFIIMKKM